MGIFIFVYRCVGARSRNNYGHWKGVRYSQCLYGFGRGSMLEKFSQTVVNSITNISATILCREMKLGYSVGSIFSNHICKTDNN